MNAAQFKDLETYVLVQRYEQDSSVTYELTSDELYKLMSVVGEMEPIIDALNVMNGATNEQRAEDIGCHPDDFKMHDDDDKILFVEELEFAASIPWTYGK